MQKGVVELISPTSGATLGYLRLFNISDSVSVQTSNWEMYPVQGATAQNIVFPLTNGTFIVTDTSQLTVESRLSLGTTVGYTGAAVSPDEKTAVLVDGPSGIIELLNLTSLQTVWKVTFNTPAGTTAYPSDARWSPDGSTIVVPLMDNNSIDILSAQTGQIEQATSLTSGSPSMVAINGQGNTLGVELSNKTDLFYSYPALKLLGSVSFAGSSISPTRGVFTPDGEYYLEASGASNSVAVISLSDFKVVNTINLPQSSAPGLANIQITPDGNYVYVNQPGIPTTGGIIYMFSLSNIATASGPVVSIPMTTAPSFAIPISMTLGNYLADNVLLPPVTGLHC
jgi:DNA-binding beta-propeller fold protein YncE